jgi:hypothetical protein
LTVNSQIGDEYLLTLCLAYIAEARCYLELEEFDTVIRRFQEGKKQINARIEKYVNLMLTDNPLMYLHPKLKGKTDLSRLTRIYQWKDSTITESAVFDLMRDNMVPQGDVWSSHINEWIKSLPTSIIESENIKKDFWGIKAEGREEIIQKLPESLAEMESMVETSRRFTAYELEIKAISTLGISFYEWLQLRPPESQDGRSLIYLVPKEPLALA